MAKLSSVVRHEYLTIVKQPSFWIAMIAIPVLIGVVFALSIIGNKASADRIEELAKDEAIQEADTVILTIPNTLGVEYNIHVLDSILKHVAPGLGWR